MQKTHAFAALLLSVCMLHPAPGWADFDMAATLDVGGWQEREEITTNNKGKVTAINVIWSGIVDREVIDGVPHVWMEMRTQGYKENRKGERKKRGDLSIMKMAIPESALVKFDDPFNNMRMFANDTVIQTGKEKPMRLRGGGMMADMMLKSFGANIDFKLQPAGTTADVETAAGSFDTYHYTGSGSVDMKVLIRKIHIDSEIEMWLSEAVPMGVVKQNITNTQGKKVTQVAVSLLAYGDGATSMINDADIMEMPGFGFQQ